ncbi:MAG: LytTR family DNA-binding domain-containing protein [Bacteroidales bacterium]|nr:LytTR family DNA-binding domain-containing protein [Bacteroidales bacterium]
MNCIIVDDEPLGRKAIQLLVKETPILKLLGSFGDADSAGKFMLENSVDLVFLDIRMPGSDGIEFAKTIPKHTLVIFTTAYSEYAVDSYDLDAIDYLLKPVELQRFQKAVEKACDYFLLLSEKPQKNHLEAVTKNYIFVKSDRRFYRILFENIIFIEGLKDYIIIQTNEQKIITKITLKSIYEQLPSDIFMRVNKSYIVNLNRIESFDSGDIFIGKHEIAIGSTYRDAFFERITKP